jgi:polyisoprenoid-binding protein YceI
MFKKILFIYLAAVFSAIGRADTWDFDKDHSQVKFNVDHLVISEVSGSFNKFDGTVKTEGDDFSTASVEFTIETASIDTDNEKRDNHLRSDDFFNAEKHPRIEFKSKSVKKVGDNKYKLTGDLTIRDVTKQVELDVKQGGIIKDQQGKTRTAFKITGTVNRFDYNLKWNALIETGGAVVGSDVDIICNVELVKA